MINKRVGIDKSCGLGRYANYGKGLYVNRKIM